MDKIFDILLENFDIAYMLSINILTEIAAKYKRNLCIFSVFAKKIFISEAFVVSLSFLKEEK